MNVQVRSFPTRRSSDLTTVGGALGALRPGSAAAAPGDPGDPAHCCRQAREFKGSGASAESCCFTGQVCYTCVAIGREKGQAVGFVSAAGCCTPGVDCPGDVHGHHSGSCQTFVKS